MKCLQRYLVFEYVKIFFGSLFFFVMILTLADIMPRIEHYFEYPSLLKYFFFYHISRTAYNAYFSFPLAAMFASTFVLGTMVKNKEVIAFFNAGISLFKFTLPLFILVITLCVLLVPYWEFVVSPANDFSFESEQIAYSRSSVRDRKNILLYGSEGNIYFIDKYTFNDNTMYNLILLKKNKNGMDEKRIRAEKTVWNEDAEVWTAYNGSEIFFDENGVGEKLHTRSFNEMILDVKEIPKHFERTKRFEALSLSDILELIKLKTAIKAKTADLRTEFQFRIAFAFSPFVIVILSTIFAKFSSQSVLVMSLALVIVSALVYYTILMLTTSFGRSGIIPPFIAAWFANIFFFCISAFLFKKFY